MYRDLSVAVVVPAFNEAQAIERTIDGIPSFIDHVLVVDDASTDATAALAAGRGWARPVEVVRHQRNRGVGAAIVSGYHRALTLGMDVVVVMAGDGQMDPADLEHLLDPIAEGRADYSKGNRFRHREVWRVMPPSRLAGNVALSIATKLVSGYWHVFDSQCGYTAISRHALMSIDLDRVFARYGYPNDLLARLHTAGMRVVDVPVRPIYGPAWKSGIRVSTVVYPMTFVLARAWATRIVAKLGRRLPPQPSPSSGPLP